MTETTPPTGIDLLRRTESYLSALHGSVARHDNLAAGFGCAGCELREQITAALRAAATVPASAPTDRAAILREAAVECDTAGGTCGARGANEAAGAAFALMERLLRLADEAEYVATPCSVGACDPGGEPCTTHERLMAHAEGDHELCAPDCGPASGPGGAAGETQQDETRKACTCSHADDEHSVYGCAEDCGCEWMPKRKPMDPVHILGIGSDEDSSALRAALLGRQQPAAVSQPGKEA